MNKIKRLLIFILMCVLCTGIFTDPVLAATVTQDGLEVTITTDKEEYSANEKVKLSVTVKNTNDFAMENIVIKKNVPDGYQLSDGSSADIKIDSLAAGATSTVVSYEVEKKEAEKTLDVSPIVLDPTKKSPDTGIETEIFLCLAAVASVAIVIRLTRENKKNIHKIFALLLCFSMVATTISVSAATNYEEKSFKVSHTVKIDNVDVTFEVDVNYQMPVADKETTPSELFFLRANKESVFIEDGADSVYLYLETKVVADEIDLSYGTADNMNQSAKMLDNGTGADDMAGDGVYSAKVSLDITTDTEVHFVAKHNELTSNTVKVYYYTPISQETYDAMNTVDSSVDTLLAGFNSNSSLTNEQKAEQTMTVLNSLEEQDVIEEGSIFHNEEDGIISFMYPEGILGGVMYDDFNLESNEEIYLNTSSGELVSNLEETVEPTEKTETTETTEVSESTEVSETTEAPTPVREEAPDSYDIYNVESGGNISMFANEIDEQAEVETIGKAIVLNSFPAFETKQSSIDYRTNFYNTLETNWEATGLDTTLIMSATPTVADYKNLEGYDVICISTHGSVYEWNDGFLWTDHHEYPAICLAEENSNAKDKSYEKELKQKQIVKVNGNYWILPSFFTANYSEAAFDGTFVFSECCMAMGTGKGSDSAKYDYSMANAFTGRSAEAYIGFHNSVFADYSREFMNDYVLSIVKGDSSGAAYKAAVEKYGENHEVWFNKTHSYTLEQYYHSQLKFYLEHKHIAYPVHNGNESAVLHVVDFANGGFEDFYASTTAPKVWECVGDIRTLTGLGTVAPTEQSRMTILTTGIGSQDSASFEGGTEGSSISQTFVVPENASKITFNYNFISEEPSEWVGSIYDDSFEVKATQGQTEFYKQTLESVNMSTWIAVDGIDFIGGDHTTFETGWKTAEIDVSAYRGQKITLDLIIYDVGDEIYDSACVIDNVAIQ